LGTTGEQGKASPKSFLSRRATTVVKQHGIDVVLGGQWGDEGKGKLVDILSQVSLFAFPCVLKRR